MEKTLAYAGRQIDNAGSEIATQASYATDMIGAAAGAVGRTAAALGSNILRRGGEHGPIALVVAPGPCLMYGAIVGTADTIFGR